MDPKILNRVITELTKIWTFLPFTENISLKTEAVKLEDLCLCFSKTQTLIFQFDSLFCAVPTKFLTVLRSSLTFWCQRCCVLRQTVEKNFLTNSQWTVCNATFPFLDIGSCLVCVQWYCASTTRCFAKPLSKNIPVAFDQTVLTLWNEITEDKWNPFVQSTCQSDNVYLFKLHPAFHISACHFSHVEIFYFDTEILINSISSTWTPLFTTRPCARVFLSGCLFKRTFFSQNSKSQVGTRMFDPCVNQFVPVLQFLWDKVATNTAFQFHVHLPKWEIESVVKLTNVGTVCYLRVPSTIWFDQKFAHVA